ncbi:hypothetical protein JNW90_15400 [Micromonospora sp. STR1s_5]|nr:hypothetical protein [Micromonospora sp. STR1s_5]
MVGTDRQLTAPRRDGLRRPAWRHQRWTEVFPAQPGLRVAVHVDLTDVVDGELLDGVAHVTGQLPEGIEPHETRMRVEFHDEAGGRTRLEIRQWLPGRVVGPADQGWNEAFSKLDATLRNSRPVAVDVEV